MLLRRAVPTSHDPVMPGGWGGVKGQREDQVPSRTLAQADLAHALYAPKLFLVPSLLDEHFFG